MEPEAELEGPGGGNSVCLVLEEALWRGQDAHDVGRGWLWGLETALCPS